MTVSGGVGLRKSSLTEVLLVIDTIYVLFQFMFYSVVSLPCFQFYLLCLCEVQQVCQLLLEIPQKCKWG